jgi:protein-S-isoprenylcysteine O-methyltransferase Ste14
MHLTDQRTLGIAILAMLAVLVGIKKKATGSIIEMPRGGVALVLGNAFNLFFLLHPMYTAALSLSAGLCCLTQSGAAVCVFCGYLAVIFVLIPLEEAGLQQAYGEPYAAYQQRVPRLLPWVY